MTHGRGKPVSARAQGHVFPRSDTVFDGKIKDWLSRAHRPRRSTSSDLDSVDGGNDSRRSVDGFVMAAGGEPPSVETQAGE